MAAILLLVSVSFSVQSADPADAEKIDINAAFLEDLVKIIHIGEVRARELISLRPFSSLDDLARISGIGEARVEDIKEQGLAWVSAQEEPEPEPTPEPKPLLSPEPEPEPETSPKEKEPISYPSGIIINEILPSPEGPDAEEEWVEIFNQNSFEVGLANWQIVDTVGVTKTYTFPEGIAIDAQEFLALPRPISKITLNNGGDGLKLIQPDGKIADFVEYGKAPRGESYNLTESGWAWSDTLTPGSTNVIPTLATEEKAESENKEEKGLAAISQLFQKEREKKTTKSPSFFLIALFVAIFSGIIILFLKKTIKNKL